MAALLLTRAEPRRAGTAGGAAISPLRAAFAGRCPRCGKGRLYSGLLKVADRCAVCGLEIGRHDAGDGPAVFVILILGFLVVGLALLLEVVYAPPMWLHVALWPPVVFGLGLVLLRFIKSLLIALQFRHRAEDYDGGA